MTKVKQVVGAKGLEPSTPWSQTRYSNQTELRPDTERHYTSSKVKYSLTFIKSPHNRPINTNLD